VLLALEVAANAIEEAGILSRDDGGLKRRPAPSSSRPRGARTNSCARYAGLGVICLLSVLTLEHAQQKVEQ
jgi:hypothetical protein